MCVFWSWIHDWDYVLSYSSVSWHQGKKLGSSKKWGYFCEYALVDFMCVHRINLKHLKLNFTQRKPSLKCKWMYAIYILWACMNLQARTRCRVVPFRVFNANAPHCYSPVFVQVLKLTPGSHQSIAHCVHGKVCVSHFERCAEHLCFWPSCRTCLMPYTDGDLIVS